MKIMAGHRNKVSSTVGILAYVSISIYNNVQNLQHPQTVVVANLSHQLGDLLECITSKQHAYLQQSKTVYQGS